MDAPKCKMCGQRHYGLCVIVRTHDRSKSEIAEIIAQKAEEAGLRVARPKFDRVAYQREYMRDWRARKKASQAPDAAKQAEVRRGHSS